MLRVPFLLIHAVAVAALFVLPYVQAVDWDVTTALDDYVNRDDGYYNWELLESQEFNDYSLHILNLTSQKWMDEPFTNDSIWFHYLSIFIPKPVQINDAGYLFVGNGNKLDGLPSPTDGRMLRTADFAVKTGAVAGYLRMVPFQPIFFEGARIGRVEDSIIGYTWKEFIENEDADPDVVALLPMTKSGKVALDAMTEFVKTQDDSIDLVKFMPTGFSKRGWVTWLLGCVDKRVFAIAPTVFDLLNMQPNLDHHFRALGGWSWAFIAYWIEDVSKYLHHPRVLDLAAIIDPISYNERLTMPKLIISAGNDQFFPPDNSHYYYDELNGPKYLQIWENADHSLSPKLDEIDYNIQAFFLNSYRGLTSSLPEISWERTESETDGQLVVTTSETPETVFAWWAETTNITCEANRNDTCRRDFRHQTLTGIHGIVWYQEEVEQLGINTFGITIEKPEFGFRIFFIEATFPGPDDYTFRFTTENHIIPDEFPYPRCESEDECRGRLI